MEIPVHWVDKLTWAELTASAALASGETLSSFEPWKLFMDEARIMVIEDEVTYKVSVLMPKRILGLKNWMDGRGTCPLEACMKAVVKRQAALASRS